MIVTLTGASGFLGVSIARELAEAGHRVVALVRSSSVTAPLEPFVYRFVQGDHADPGIRESLLKGVDGVVHNSFDWEALQSRSLDRHLTSNLVGSLELIDAAHRASIPRFVYMSSVAVHHAISDRWAGVIDEDHPLRPGGLYGACKAAVEAHLWAAHHSWGMHTVALRPPAVYGVEPVRLSRSHGYQQVRKLLAGETITKADFPGGGKWVHVDDVARATREALERPEASGRAFHLADCYAKFTRLAQFAAEALGLPEDRVFPDDSPPARNQFDKTECRKILGVPLDRGEDGLRAAMFELVRTIRSREECGSIS